MKPKLRVENVYKIFGNQPEAALARLRAGDSKKDIFEATGQTVGVEDASFTVNEGEIFVVMGLSGSGKSTLVRMLNGLIRPTSGKVLIDDDDVASCSAKRLREVRREKITMVFQHFALFPHKTVAENAAYGLKIKGVSGEERRAKALDALSRVGLEHYADSFPADLSGGMQQRVGLARGLATNPQILLMDEPFGALDPLIRREMQDELIHLQRELKKTIVFITHDLNEALLLGDRIAIMKDGRFVQIGTAQEIVDNPAGEYVAAFVADIDRGRVFSAHHVAQDVPSVQLEEHTPESALKTMEDHNRSALYVMDGKEIAGVVTYQDLTVASREDGAELRDSLITEYPTVEGGTPLNELYGAASAGLPVAVTDSENRLVGVVDPHAVLAQLSGDEQPDAETDVEENDKKTGEPVVQPV
ncbi:quaternary amine ABC transporter ATP-binding protein [Limoniibacter endophyticus]|uniref:Quaternary amine transport ATP-binding protein n=1 Tax=Limoniibacter endophyticus TaxID=1565040 RepID=A0A8J3DJC4_9HYPH|nr:glycine betaine/L-proline ABC transporter ATP-binding protein [Limoniibacter endophyticus]GHC77659.1 glycine/betaine ABC transporter ATP-binding protein [Limoniibacter endophyticus]